MNKQWQSIVKLALVAGLALTGLTACGSEKKGESKKVEVTVSLQLDWIDDVEYSGFYMAEDKGYYQEEALKVDMRTSVDADGNYVDVLGELTSGNAQFALMDAGYLMTSRADGAPVVAIASIYQRHPLAFLSLADKNITRPADLVGKTIQIFPGVNGVLLNALLASQGIDPTDVNIVERTAYDASPLLNGEADVIDAWITNEVVQLSLAGEEFDMIFPIDFGVELYPAMLVTTEDMIANHADVVERFVRASIKGLQAAVADPEKAVELTLARDNTLDSSVTSAGMQRALPLFLPAGGKVGMMDVKAWETGYQILVDQGLVSASLELQKVYAMDFLNQVYEE